MELQVFKLEDPCLDQLCQEGYEREAVQILISDLYRLVGGHPLLWQSVLNADFTRDLLKVGQGQHFSEDQYLEFIDRDQAHIRYQIAELIQKGAAIASL